MRVKASKAATMICALALQTSPLGQAAAAIVRDPPGADLPPGSPFATTSTLPFQAPRFDRIVEGDFKPAIEAGIVRNRAEARAIADDPAAPTFANTIVALERAGALLGGVQALFGNLVQTDSTPVLQALNEEEAPHLQALNDEIMLDARLFARVKRLYDARDGLGLNAEQSFLLERYYRRFVHAGAQLDAADKATLTALDGRVAALQAQYQGKLLAAGDAGAVVVSDKTELDGLSPAEIAVTVEAAKARKLDGRYVIALRNTTQQPILASLSNRALRARILAASESRGDAPGPNDLRDIIETLAQLRAQKARLLGFPTFSAYTLTDQMAKSPRAAKALLTQLAPAATAKARAEAAEIQTVMDRDHAGVLTASDWSYYADKVRKAKYSVDDGVVKQYFELDRVLQDGVFYAANQLYGLTFKPRTDVPVYHDGVRVWEVFDADGKSLALFYADYFARPSKTGGAWCNFLNQPSGLEHRQPLVVNVANFTKPVAGEPALISFDDVTTMFHEFGHALHAMFSVRYYPSEDGFNLPTDVIEFPSQFNEHWALEPKVFAHYAVDHRTGAPMPQALVDKLKAARDYGQGYATTELLAAALLDLEWHDLSPDAPKPKADAFEAAALAKDGVALAQVPPRYRSPYFLHIWGNGYESNYYSYTWGEILDDDAFEWFTEHGGLTRANGQRFRDRMLGPGYTADPMALYRDFRGRDPSVKALERQRGLD